MATTQIKRKITVSEQGGGEVQDVAVREKIAKQHEDVETKFLKTQHHCLQTTSHMRPAPEDARAFENALTAKTHGHHAQSLLTIPFAQFKQRFPPRMLEQLKNRQYFTKSNGTVVTGAQVYKALTDLVNNPSNYTTESLVVLDEIVALEIAIEKVTLSSPLQTKEDLLWTILKDPLVDDSLVMYFEMAFVTAKLPLIHVARDNTSSLGDSKVIYPLAMTVVKLKDLMQRYSNVSDMLNDMNSGVFFTPTFHESMLCYKQTQSGKVMLSEVNETGGSACRLIGVDLLRQPQIDTWESDTPIDQLQMLSNLTHAFVGSVQHSTVRTSLVPLFSPIEFNLMMPEPAEMEPDRARQIPTQQPTDYKWDSLPGVNENQRIIFDFEKYAPGTYTHLYDSSGRVKLVADTQFVIEQSQFVSARNVLNVHLSSGGMFEPNIPGVSGLLLHTQGKLSALGLPHHSSPLGSYAGLYSRNNTGSLGIHARLKLLNHGLDPNMISQSTTRKLGIWHNGVEQQGEAAAFYSSDTTPWDDTDMHLYFAMSPKGQTRTFLKSLNGQKMAACMMRSMTLLLNPRVQKKNETSLLNGSWENVNAYMTEITDTPWKRVNFDDTYTPAAEPLEPENKLMTDAMYLSELEMQTFTHIPTPLDHQQTNAQLSVTLCANFPLQLFLHACFFVIKMCDHIRMQPRFIQEGARVVVSNAVIPWLQQYHAYHDGNQRYVPPPMTAEVEADKLFNLYVELTKFRNLMYKRDRGQDLQHSMIQEIPTLTVECETALSTFQPLEDFKHLFVRLTLFALWSVNMRSVLVLYELVQPYWTKTKLPPADEGPAERTDRPTTGSAATGVVEDVVNVANNFVNLYMKVLSSPFDRVYAGITMFFPKYNDSLSLLMREKFDNAFELEPEDVPFIFTSNPQTIFGPGLHPESPDADFILLHDNNRYNVLKYLNNIYEPLERHLVRMRRHLELTVDVFFGEWEDDVIFDVNEPYNTHLRQYIFETSSTEIRELQNLVEEMLSESVTTWRGHWQPYSNHFIVQRPFAQLNPQVIPQVQPDSNVSTIFANVMNAALQTSETKAMRGWFSQRCVTPTTEMLAYEKGTTKDDVSNQYSLALQRVEYQRLWHTPLCAPIFQISEAYSHLIEQRNRNELTFELSGAGYVLAELLDVKEGVLTFAPRPEEDKQILQYQPPWLNDQHDSMSEADMNYLNSVPVLDGQRFLFKNFDNVVNSTESYNSYLLTLQNEIPPTASPLSHWLLSYGGRVFPLSREQVMIYILSSHNLAMYGGKRQMMWPPRTTLEEWMNPPQSYKDIARAVNRDHHVTQSHMLADHLSMMWIPASETLQRTLDLKQAIPAPTLYASITPDISHTFFNNVPNAIAHSFESHDPLRKQYLPSQKQPLRVGLSDLAGGPKTSNGYMQIGIQVYSRQNMPFQKLCSTLSADVSISTVATI